MRPTVREIATVAAAHFELPPGCLVTTGASRKVAHPRQIVMYLARKMGCMSYPAIGKALNRDHTTVLYGLREVESRMDDGVTLPAILAIAAETTRLVRDREARDRALIHSLHIERARLDQMALDLVTACVESRPRKRAKALPAIPENARWTAALFDRRAA